MLDKEVLDYIKVQRDFGVNDTSIKKSLINAGYNPQEITESMKKIENKSKHKFSKSTTPKMDLTLSNKTLFILNVCISFLMIGLIFYSVNQQNNRMDFLENSQQYTIESLNKTLNQQADKLNLYDSHFNTVDLSVKSIQSQMQTMNSQIDEKLESYNYDSLHRDSILSSNLQEINAKSSSDIFQVQSEFKELKSSTADFSEIIPQATEAVVQIGEEKELGVFNLIGSGVFINSIGYIVTNYHVIDEIKDIKIKTHSGGEYTAKVIGNDEEYDIALLKLNTIKKGFTYLEWANSDKIEVGQRVIAIGNPLGLSSTVTEGIISNIARRIGDNYYIQTDVAINQGNSGGPLIDKNGDIIGITSRKFSGDKYEGLGFALRSNDVKNKILVMSQT